MGVGYGDMLTNCLAPGDMHLALHPSFFLVERVEMSVEGNIVRLSLERLATQHYHDNWGMRLECSLVF